MIELRDADIICSSNSKSSNANNSYSHTSSSSLSYHIGTLKEVQKIFAESVILRSTGNGRSEKMVSITKSYICILVFVYENVYKYGSSSTFITPELQTHYMLNCLVLNDLSKRKEVLDELLGNWKDVLQTLGFMKMDTTDGSKIRAIQSDIDKVTACFDYFSTHQF